MVLVKGIKYACERCIRGHRVTTCNHTDQPLMMIKPKGRPSTTCSHCKELRRNKNANPTGACTCGRQEKKRLAQKAKEEARSNSKLKDDSCRCIEGDKCSCHVRRATRRSASSRTKGTTTSSIASEDSPTMSALDGSDFIGRVGKNHGLNSLPSFHSSQSLDRDFSLATSPPFSPTLHGGNHNASNWDSSSITSSLMSESRLNLLDRGQPSFVPGHGDSATNGNKHVTKQGKTRIGEAPAPQDEISDLNSLSGSFDNMGFQNRMAWPQTDTKHGLLDLFADTSENANIDYKTLKHNHHKGCGVTSSEKPKSPGLSQTNNASSRSVSYHRDVPKSLTSRPSVDSTTSDSSRYSISGLTGRDSSATTHSISQVQGGHQPYIDARQLQPHASFGKDNHPPGFANLKDENSQSVEVLSLTPSFMDIPDNSNLYSATSNPFLHAQEETEPRKRSVSIHRNHRYDSFSRESLRNMHSTSFNQSSLSYIDTGMKQPDFKFSHSLHDSTNSVPTIANAPSSFRIEESPDSDNGLIPQASNLSSPNNGMMTRPMEPTSSFISEIDEILGCNNNDDVQSLFSGPSICRDMTNEINVDGPSITQNAKLSPAMSSEPASDFNFNDLDKLMSDS
ncbi:LANO_0C03158g1_1 [Lachancea nothofagi CBS 11611]|uniref:LANO_0C03158g1_1 n=1 Tax=Lachancea nothofagi CBS 11611 TaxID=1266666 RepID=A0A1G4J5R2_9SACH|nr:LANO_0C03158g1_1 [Lachancea nothofagi CBS 11611]